MTWIQTVILGIVEGLTEFLPVSSTGHMIIVQSLLGIKSDEFIKAFTVVIQFGAILSVIVLYFKRFFQSWDFYLKLILGCIPAAVLGLLFNKKIDELLGSVTIVATMLVLGGIVMLFVDKWFDHPASDQRITNKNAFLIGCFQCISMIPGVSRSMATIVGGMSRKLTRKNAAEFSFFIAIPTMAGATGLTLYKLIKSPDGMKILSEHANILLLGNIVAFVVAVLAIKFFISFVTKYGFKLFGWYRIIIGGLILIMMLLGHELTV